MQKKEKWDRNEITGKQFGFFMNMGLRFTKWINDKSRYKTQHQNKLYHSIASVVHIANTVRYDVCRRHSS